MGEPRELWYVISSTLTTITTLIFQLGNVVRQGPNKLVFHSVNAVRGKDLVKVYLPSNTANVGVPDIYKSDRATKPEAYMALGPDLTIHTTLTARDKQAHRSSQQLVGQVLSGRFMRTFESTMIEQVDLFIERIRASANRSVPVNMTERAKYLTFNIATLLAFGYDLKLQTSEENKSMPTLLEKAVFWSNVFLQWPGIRKYKFLLSIFQSARQTKGRYIALVKKMIGSRMRQGEHGPQDLYSVFDKAMKANNSDIRHGELWAEANTFLPGGKL